MRPRRLNRPIHPREMLTHTSMDHMHPIRRNVKAFHRILGSVLRKRKDAVSKTDQLQTSRIQRPNHRVPQILLGEDRRDEIVQRDAASRCPVPRQPGHITSIADLGSTGDMMWYTRGRVAARTISRPPSPAKKPRTQERTQITRQRKPGIEQDRVKERRGKGVDRASVFRHVSPDFAIKLGGILVAVDRKANGPIREAPSVMPSPPRIGSVESESRIGRRWRRWRSCCRGRVRARPG